MQLKDLIGLDEEKNNIIRVNLPYFLLRNKPEIKERQMVIFFGGAPKDLTLSEPQKYYSKMNECLDYVRKNYADYELVYKPHPADLEEKNHINLSGFNIIEEKSNAEIYLWKNLQRIEHAFAVNSWSAAVAFSFGLKANVFYPCFKNILSAAFIKSTDAFFREMPAQFFINNLNVPLSTKEIGNIEDKLLISEIKRILGSKEGTVWMTIAVTDYIAIVLATAKIIKGLDPKRKINLIISRHHRWEVIDLDRDIKSFFDSIFILPRIFYSLKPKRLAAAVSLALKIRRWNIGQNDIIFGTSHFEFVENCFVSYHRKAKRILMIMQRDINWYYNPQSFLFSQKDFRWNKASYFYNKILEPLLGLFRTVYLSYKKEDVFNLNRYQKPLNRVYDEVIILKVPRA
jgi:hypothetical protein